MTTARGPILVPIDFSEECRLILEFAERLAEKSDDDLLVLHVAGFRDPLRQRPPLLQTAPLEDCVRSITRVPPHRVNMLMQEGEAIEGILRAARHHCCSEIVMGRGGTLERAGHVALAIKQNFPGKIHMISRFQVEAPIV